MVKLKIKAKGDSQPPTPSSELPPTPGGSLKLKIKTNSKSGASGASAPSTSLPPPPPPPVAAEAPKPKRKYTKKKDKDENDGTPEKVAKPGRKRKAKEMDEDTAAPMKIRIPSISFGAAAPATAPAAPTAKLPKISIPNSTVKIRLSSAKQRTSSTPNIRLKAKGKPPYRPAGVGYDSEGEDIEVDPAIEQQFVLRMQPGEDCDYLRDAIANKRIGIPAAAGGAEVAMRFFDKEGRRAMVSIRGHHYAASLLDLPCIVESMKSWDRKGWYKAADICQILLVTQRVKDEAEAKKAALPREVDAANWQYPHGLTPPMHYVRKRRFRKRLNFRTIEAVEDEVERLLRIDDEAEKDGGAVEYRLMDYDAYLRESEQAEDQAAADAEAAATGAYGDVIPGYEVGDDEGAPDEAENEGDLAALMEQEFAAAGGDDPAGHAAHPRQPILHPAGPVNASPTSLLPPGATPDSAGPSPSATGTATGTGTEDDDPTGPDGDGDGDGLFSDSASAASDAAPVDEEELARQQERAQQREEIADLRGEIAAAELQVARQANPLLKQRAAAKLRSLRADLQLKIASLGEDAE